MAKIKTVRDIPLDDLVIGKAQVRKRDVGKDIDELAESIRVVGLLEPIVVAPADKPGKFEIITGQRRFLAHQLLGRLQGAGGFGRRGHFLHRFCLPGPGGKRHFVSEIHGCRDPGRRQGHPLPPLAICRSQGGTGIGRS